ncbi:YbaL family putative K(+) efflux transporter [Conservatibacter flavescens]|uniref:Kef family K(+) transporter n=1 Tax=Conservatibacter flavescens TaxID=28161 RepID=A0A2M8S620_9PAST|nr:YbaL family putative K(+) efflux transporter [Conservatibacter flavescens]PJG86589.1 Kef family K(+) transporter [Conservatibacter flavescens]
MHPSTPLISMIAIGLAGAYILGMIANRLKISPLVGYLLAGIMIGPFTPGFEGDLHIAHELSELGVMLLMFGVGLHFSLKDLLSVKYVAIPGALLQIASAIVFGWIFSTVLGWSTISGLVFGLCLSTASTVVLLRALEEQQLLETMRGKIAIGWLIVEDLAMVLALVLLPAVAEMLQQENANFSNMLGDFAITIGKVIAFVAVMLIIGKRVIPWLIARSAATGSRELFTLSVLAIALGIAYGSVHLFDVSFALGAFFAGMILNESELSHRAANDTLPLRDAFAVLFFVSVGMLFDPMILVESPLSVLATVIIIVFGKSIAAYLLVRLLRKPKRTALTVSISLAQIGEFAFILAGLAVSLGLLDEQGRNLVLAGSIISILLNPILFTYLEKFTHKTEEQENLVTVPQKEELEDDFHQSPLTLKDHIILVGDGRVGSLIGNKLRAKSIPFAVIEASHSHVEKLHEEGVDAIFGNVKDIETLELAAVQDARLVMFATPNAYENADIIKELKEKYPHIKAISYATYSDEKEALLESGADVVIHSSREVARSMFESCLVMGECAIEPNETEELILVKN